MTIPSIFAVLTGTDASASVLAAAKAISRGKSHIEAVYIRPRLENSSPLALEAMSGAAASRLMESLAESADLAATLSRAQFDDAFADATHRVIAAGEELPGQTGTAVFQTMNGNVDDLVSRRGRLFDLVAVPSPSLLSEGAGSPMLETALFQTGKPVLVAPSNAPEIIGRKVLFCWNGSREAARALVSCLPLLKAADLVTVLTCNDGGAEGADPAEVVLSLSRHEISADARIAALDGGIGATLLKEADRTNADVIVMGGYGHSRFREFVLGGATRSLLLEANHALIMAH